MNKCYIVFKLLNQFFFLNYKMLIQNLLKWPLQTGFISFMDRFRWPLVVVDRWSLFRGRFSTKIAWAGFGVVVVDRWSLFGGGR